MPKGRLFFIPGDDLYEIVSVRGASLMARKVGAKGLHWIIAEDLPLATIFLCGPTD